MQISSSGAYAIEDFYDLGFTRNFGVKLSSGKYIKFLNGDNLYCQNWIC